MERCFGNSRPFRCGLGGIKRHAMNRLALCLALLCAASSAYADLPDGDVPKVAVYIAEQETDELKVLSTLILEAFVNSEKYETIERSKSILQELANEHVAQRSGDVDDSQIKRLGKQAGVDFICVIAATPVFGVYQVSSRLINVETARVTKIGVTDSPLKNTEDVNAAASVLVERMLNPRNPLRSAANEVVGTMLGIPGRELPPLPPPPPPQPMPPQPMPPPPEYQPPTYVQYVEQPDLKTISWYVALKYHTPILDVNPSWGAISSEFGRVSKNRWFFGFDLGFGYSRESIPNSKYYLERGNAGINADIGGAISLATDLQFLYGVALGYWIFYKGGYGSYYEDGFQVGTEQGFMGPVVKLRWLFMELSYRGLVGNGWKTNGESGGRTYISYNSQLMLGFNMHW